MTDKEKMEVGQINVLKIITQAFTEFYSIPQTLLGTEIMVNNETNSELRKPCIIREAGRTKMASSGEAKYLRGTLLPACVGSERLRDRETEPTIQGEGERPKVRGQ